MCISAAMLTPELDISPGPSASLGHNSLPAEVVGEGWSKILPACVD